MPPGLKFTKEEIINAALCLVREKGISALTARGLAEKLGSSPKPIFGLFSNMDEVKTEVTVKANELYQSFLSDEMAKDVYPPYKASGMAYIRFAKEETQLFKLLFMRDRSNEIITQNKEETAPLVKMIREKLNISEEKAYLFHLEMWVYVHGIATMLATSYLNWDLNFISNSLTDIFEGLSRRYSNGGN